MLASKKYVKRLCYLRYLTGFGDCWYEKPSKSPMTKRMYMSWAVFFNVFIVSGLINEVLACARSDLMPSGRNDVITALFARPLIYAKAVVLFLARDQMKEVLKSLFIENNNQFFSAEIDKAAVKKAVLWTFFYCLNVIATNIFMTIDAVIAYYKTGTKIQNEITFYPSADDSGNFVNILRFIIYAHSWIILFMMCINDCIMLFILVIIESKFKLLQSYFLSLRQNILEEGKIRSVKEREFIRDFRIGMILLEDTLCYVRRIKSTVSKVNGIQILQSISLLASLLIEMVNGDRTFTFIASILMFMVSLAFLTGAYMTIPGDITYEAGKLPTCIFHSGWELCRPTAQLRCLVGAALLRSQIPVRFTAFSVVNLSYSTFIAVLRYSYSFFAVMY